MILTTALFFSSAAAGLPVYEVEKLTPAFDFFIYARHAINDSGDFVGQITVNGQSHAARLRHGVITDLGLPANANGCNFDSSVATGTNNLGTVVGYARGTCGFKAVVWKDGTTTLMEGVKGTPRDINDSDVIVGENWIYDHGIVHTLQTYESPGNTLANTINDLGQVAGETYLSAGGHSYAAVWDADGWLLQVWPTTSSTVVALNDVGQAAMYRRWQGRTSLYRWTWATNVFEPIDVRFVLGPNADAAVRDINNRGEVVGVMWSGPSTTSRSFYWNGGIVRSLNALTPGVDPYLENEAYAINEGGEIAGAGKEYDRFGVQYTKPLVWQQTGEVWE